MNTTIPMMSYQTMPASGTFHCLRDRPKIAPQVPSEQARDLFPFLTPLRRLARSHCVGHLLLQRERINTVHRSDLHQPDRNVAKSHLAMPGHTRITRPWRNFPKRRRF